MPAFNDLAPQHLDALAAFIANPGAAGPAIAGGAEAGEWRDCLLHPD
jgi:hypothetical protein